MNEWFRSPASWMVVGFTGQFLFGSHRHGAADLPAQSAAGACERSRAAGGGVTRAARGV